MMQGSSDHAMCSKGEFISFENRRIKAGKEFLSLDNLKYWLEARKHTVSFIKMLNS